MTEISSETIWQDITEIRSSKPLVHNITNYVVMNTTANALLALGASPVMAHSLNEVKEMVGIASALVINIGTLSPKWIGAMEDAMLEARRIGVPIVLDPVGVGATNYRTKTARRFLKELTPTVVRGNASEIMALLSDNVETKGVDSLAETSAAEKAACNLSTSYECVACVSGAEDIIAGKEGVIKIQNGDPLMCNVTGLGCTASALTGAFCAVNQNYLAAAAHAIAVLGIVGELAAKESKGPGSLQLNILDRLYSLEESDLQANLKVLEQ